MIVETGHYALVLTLAVAILVAVFPVIGAKRHDSSLMALAAKGSIAQFVLVLISFSTLVWAYETSDFSVKNVW